MRLNTENFNISPAQFLTEIGWRFVARGDWLSLRKCPFCDGGNNGDVFTFAVHATGGNYFCHRTKCSVKGSFWALIETQNRNPRDYLGERKKHQKSKKNFIYGNGNGR